MISTVTEALNAVGGHRWVPFEVTRAECDPASVEIWVTLRYRVATPVCCSEPSCYIGFLGQRTCDVPHALAARLDYSTPPNVRIHLSARFEPGYRFSQLDLGAKDWDTVYEPEHFTAAASPR